MLQSEDTETEEMQEKEREDLFLPLAAKCAQAKKMLAFRTSALHQARMEDYNESKKGDSSATKDAKWKLAAAEAALHEADAALQSAAHKTISAVDGWTANDAEDWNNSGKTCANVRKARVKMATARKAWEAEEKKDKTRKSKGGPSPATVRSKELFDTCEMVHREYNWRLKDIGRLERSVAAEQAQQEAKEALEARSHTRVTPPRTRV